MRSGTCSSFPSFHKAITKESWLINNRGTLIEQLKVTSVSSLITMCRTVGLNLTDCREWFTSLPFARPVLGSSDCICVLLWVGWFILIRRDRGNRDAMAESNEAAFLDGTRCDFLISDLPSSLSVKQRPHFITSFNIRRQISTWLEGISRRDPLTATGHQLQDSLHLWRHGSYCTPILQALVGAGGIAAWRDWLPHRVAPPFVDLWGPFPTQPLDLQTLGCVLPRMFPHMPPLLWYEITL